MLKREDVPHTFDFEALKRVESERDALLARVIELEESYASLKASTYGQALEARECRAKIKDHLLAKAKAEARVADLEKSLANREEMLVDVLRLLNKERDKSDKKEQP